MDIGEKIREARGLSQNALASELGVHHSSIGKYERDEVKPSVDVVKRVASVLDTTVGYLLGESEEAATLKDPAMLKRLNDIASFPDRDREHILYTLDAMIKSVKLKSL